MIGMKKEPSSKKSVRSVTAAVGLVLQICWMTAAYEHDNPLQWLPSEAWQNLTGMKLHPCMGAEQSAAAQREKIETWMRNVKIETWMHLFPVEKIHFFFDHTKVQTHGEVPKKHQDCGLSIICEVPVCDDVGACSCPSGRRVFNGIGCLDPSYIKGVCCGIFNNKRGIHGWLQ